MITRHEAALRLDIPLEMARRHDLPTRMTEEEFARFESDPPAWLMQSRSNRPSGARPVWVQLRCDVCGFEESARPKKWWPAFSYLSCDHHSPLDLPTPGDGLARSEIDGIGSRFVGIVDGRP
jgi:hypothetical protein